MKRKKFKIFKAKGGGMDASSPDFGGSGFAPSPGDTGGAGGHPSDPGSEAGSNFGSPTGTSFSQTESANNVQARKGPVQVPTIGPLSLGFNLISRSLYNKKNLEEQKKEDPLGGEMLTTRPKTTKQVTINDRGDNTPPPPQLCPDGSNPPCKSPAVQYVAPKQTSKFLEGFKSYDEGGEIVISSNVDKDLL